MPASHIVRSPSTTTGGVRVRHQQLGVDVIDPLGHHIGMAAAMNFRWSDKRQADWFPVDGSKHVLVGEFDSFDISDSAGGDEWDWEIRISPYPPFRAIFDRVVAGMSEADRKEHLLRRDRGRGFVVECEITPDEGFRDNDIFEAGWFHWFNSSSLHGEAIGVYGPWVRNRGHGGRPEIHPCEIICRPLPEPPCTRRLTRTY